MPFFLFGTEFTGVGKGFFVTGDGSQIISVMRDRAQINRVMRDFTTITRHVIFLRNFRDFRHYKLEAETLKSTKIWDKLLALFSRFSTSDFLRSNDKRMLVNVVNISFYFSVMRDRYLPPQPRLQGFSIFLKEKSWERGCPPASPALSPCLQRTKIVLWLDIVTL